MGRDPSDILADKILAETGSGHERYAAEQRLMDDYEEYAESRARIHALEKQLAEEERKKRGISVAEDRWETFLIGIITLGISIGPLLMLVGMVIAAASGKGGLLFVTGSVLSGLSILVYIWATQGKK